MNWHQGVFELILAHGASLTRGWPVALALMNKIRPALGVLKKFPDHEHLKRQADLALRFHAKYGSPKWVALMLWAGADPLSVGPAVIDDQDEDWEPDEESDSRSAVHFALSGGHTEILKKLLSLAAESHDRERLLQSACFGTDDAILTVLLEHGHRPDALPDHGTGLISLQLWELASDRAVGTVDSFARGGRYNASSRMRMLRLLIEHGARWLPETEGQIAAARRHVLRTNAECLLCFVGVLAEHGSARRRDVEELLRTAAVARLLGDKAKKAHSLVAALPST